ncbi:single-stranded DNA-binding protein [Bifidobacterium jacchi]|uniref:Single-stranded DNA-binding protein n=1 Tax=Bifidobacterium jacchi TaxID=2490545 RepID=A0A5N5RN57_9BIFI|nr:single-stranded DNA-binding protein [Bifidobacterium jacchi]KAB5608390.1 single-stranded DNA-binding protein [Bifidobacterium jacchi]
MAVNVTFAGNVGRDPETRTFQNGHSLTTFSVGVSQGYFDTSRQWVDQGTMWVTVECSPTAARQLPYVAKGARVLVTGLLSQRFYQKKDGSQGSELRCYAHALGFLHKPQQQGQQSQPSQQAAGPQQAAPAAQSQGMPVDPWASNAGSDAEWNAAAGGEPSF